MIRLVPKGYRTRPSRNRREAYMSGGGKFIVDGKLTTEGQQLYFKLMCKWKGFIPFLFDRYYKLMRYLYTAEGEDAVAAEIKIGVFNALYYYQDGHKIPWIV